MTKSFIDREDKTSPQQMECLDKEIENIKCCGGLVKNVEFQEKVIIIHWEPN